MCKPEFQSQQKHIHERSIHERSPRPRHVLDQAVTIAISPATAVWKVVVEPAFNNFEKFKPAHRYPSDLTLKLFNPNNCDTPH